MVQHYDDVNSFGEGNEAVLENDMALRIQPKAPASTRYYYTDNAKGWVRLKAGNDIASSVDVYAVRSAVKRAIPKNDSMGGGGVKAVSKEEL